MAAPMTLPFVARVYVFVAEGFVASFPAMDLPTSDMMLLGCGSERCGRARRQWEPIGVLAIRKTFWFN